ncbi:MAG TPA: hypothetical protein VMA71_07110, partial [Alloacidobacterium sp.]|nr:hypothetical protein [Alloacidobacterium sp.]
MASTLFPGALYTLAAQEQAKPEGTAKITPEMIDAAAALAGVTISAEQKQMMLDGLNQQREAYGAIRKLNLPNNVPPAYIFDPLPPGAKINTEKHEPRYSKAPAATTAPANLEELAFASVVELGDLVRRRKVSSTNLTEMYIARIKRYDPVLHFVVTITEERAL